MKRSGQSLVYPPNRERLDETLNANVDTLKEAPWWEHHEVENPSAADIARGMKFPGFVSPPPCDGRYPNEIVHPGGVVSLNQRFRHLV